MPNANYGRKTDWALDGATWTMAAGALDTSYDITELSRLQPEKRLLCTSGTATFRATLGSPVVGAVFALPFSNIDAGALTLTNNSGLSVAVTMPTMPLDRIPLTATVDLTGFPLGTRTASQWNLVVSGNSSPILIGAAVWLGTEKREFIRNFKPAFKERELQHKSIVPNDHGVEFRQIFGTRSRWVSIEVALTDADVPLFKSWYRSNLAGDDVSFFWPDPTVNDSYIGNWPDDYEITIEDGGKNYNTMSLLFKELNKGKQLAA